MDTKREDNQQGEEVFVSLITTFQGIKKALYLLGLKSEQRMSQNYAHYFAGCVSDKSSITQSQAKLVGTL